LFQSGSLGKQFTSAGIMALVEDGLLDLDGSVTEYLPEAPETWQPITIHHLLTHSSGIPDYTSEGFDYQTNYTEEDLVMMASGLELEFPAGDRWNYSNTGYAMLGVVMSRVAGMPYWEFLRERIFSPAGMPTIRINTESDVVPHRARGYLPVADGWRNAGYVAPMTNTTADGSMLLNLHDMIAWNDVVANRRILSEPSWDLILNPMTLNSGRSYPYGFGWFLEEAGGQTVQQHGGNWQGFSTQFTRFIGDDLAVIVLANARSFDVAGLPNTIGALLNPSLERAPPPSTPIADPDPGRFRIPPPDGLPAHSGRTHCPASGHGRTGSHGTPGQAAGGRRCVASVLGVVRRPTLPCARVARSGGGTHVAAPDSGGTVRTGSRADVSGASEVRRFRSASVPDPHGDRRGGICHGLHGHRGV